MQGGRGNDWDKPVRVRILGPLEVFHAEGYLRVGAAKWRALLATLVVNNGQVMSIDQLSAQLWGDLPPRGAVNQIHGYVMRLRRCLGDPDGRILVTRSPGYQLTVEPVEIDTGRFELLADDGLAAFQAGDHRHAAVRLAEALALWRGRALADVPVTPLVQVEAARLEERRLAVLEARIEADMTMGGRAGLIPELRALTNEHPLREGLWSKLMLALYRCGRRADALAAYQQVRQVLRDELGIDPGAALRQLHQQILNADPTLDPSSPSAAALVPAPPQAAVRPAQLPADSAAFTGRVAELEQLLAREHGGAVVIHAIDGMAGIGKTALAVHAAHRLVPRFPDGQLFLDLHGFTENMAPLRPAEALDRLLRALDVPAQRIPAGVEDRAALLRSQLAGRQMLMVLDNAATEAQVRPLLPGTPGCLVLIASRHRLTGLDDACPLSLDVLPLPDAVDLFKRITGHTRRGDLRVIEEIVDLCGRLPLAIRIAAARIRARPTWTIAHLADRLRDERRRLAEFDAGERSLVAAFRLSYQQLTADQQRMFRLLGLHPGPDVDAFLAAATADTGPERADELLEDLVDAHLLLQPSPGRYQFHDFLRTYAADCAYREDGEPDRDAAIDRLLTWYLYTASRAMDLFDPNRRQLPTPPPVPTTPSPTLDDQSKALAWLEIHLANHLAVTRYAAVRGWHGHVWRILHTLSRFFYLRGYYVEWSQTRRLALTAARQLGDRWAEAETLHQLAHADSAAGRHHQALAGYQLALAIRREIGDLAGEAETENNLGIAHKHLGNYPQALHHLNQALARCRETGRQSFETYVLGNLSVVHLTMGQYLEALDQMLVVHSRFRLAGNDRGEAGALGNLGLIYERLGRYQEAADAQQRSLTLNSQLGMSRGRARALANLGNISRHTGRCEQSLRQLRDALEIIEQIGDLELKSFIHNSLAETYRDSGEYAPALEDHHRALTLARTTGSRQEGARAHRGIGDVQHLLGEPIQARRNWQQAMKVYTELGVPMPTNGAASFTEDRKSDIT